MFLGIDLGLSSLKLCLIDDDGKLRVQKQTPIKTHFPAPLQAEQNPREWWQALDDLVSSLKHDPDIDTSAIKALSVTAGTHIAVLCDTHGAPIRPAILWSDQRATASIAKIDDLPERETGNQLSATWSLAHLLWLRDNEPHTIKQMDHIVFAKDWLRGRLTGDRLTDPGDGCGSMLMNFKTQSWSTPVLELSGLNPDHLPEIVAPETEAGALKPELVQRWGLSPQIKSYVGSIDTTVEWLCWGAPEVGQTTLKFASAGVVSRVNQGREPRPPVSLYPHLNPAQSYYAAGMNQCMTSLAWISDRFFTSAEDMYNAAAKSPAGAHGVQFYPYLNGERAPLWRSDLTASLVNMTRATHLGDIGRAAIEGLGFAFREIYDSLPSTHELLEKQPIGLLGGGSAQPLLCQITADILGRPVKQRPERDAAYGAAIFAAHASGILVTAPAETVTVIEPNHAVADLYEEAYRRFINRRASLYPTSSD